jgi:hypothetical protein
VWTSGDANSRQRYESLPAELRLRSFLGLVDPTPTGWIPVLRGTRADGVRSTLTPVLVARESLGVMMADAGWSTLGLGEASSDCGTGGASSRAWLRTNMVMKQCFFAQVRCHHGLVEPPIELTPSFIWWLELIPSGGGQ